MADQSGAADAPEDADTGVQLPEPAPDLLAAPGGDNLEFRRSYFDPEKWDAESSKQREQPQDDPVAADRGRLEGKGTAALFVSDFHIGDGTAGGDDFLEDHLHPDDEFGGLYTGFFPPGASRARLFLSVLTFARQRVARFETPRLDVVLNGDVINFLELKGRGGSYVADVHAPFFRGLAAVRESAAVYWLRGNHDYVVPTGPWQTGEFYTNANLRTLAEHGDFWDKENWPPGTTNKGSRVVIEGGSAFEVLAGVWKEGAVKYLMSGLDNLRPWSNDAVKGFMKRRAKYSEVAALAAVMARLKYLGAADDSAAYKGAQQRRQGPYADWLMVQGHTHVPAAVPGVYYNLGTWITTLVAPGGKEAQVEAFPFLLVYTDPLGRRVEEYYFVRHDAAGTTPRAVLQSPPSVNRQRQEYGYPDMNA